MHCPDATVAVQLWIPLLTVTLPVGVPLPGASTVTLKLTVTASPTTDGSGVSLVMLVVVSALLTVCGVLGVEVLPLKLASPT